MTGVLRLHKIHLPPELRAQYAALSKQFTTNIPAKIVYILMMIWFTFRGMIAFELSGQLAVSGEDTSSWFHHIFLNLLRDNGFDLTDYLQEQQHIQAN